MILKISIMPFWPKAFQCQLCSSGGMCVAHVCPCWYEFSEESDSLNRQVQIFAKAPYHKRGICPLQCVWGGRAQSSYRLLRGMLATSEGFAPRLCQLPVYHGLLREALHVQHDIVLPELFALWSKVLLYVSDVQTVQLLRHSLESPDWVSAYLFHSSQKY